MDLRAVPIAIAAAGLAPIPAAAQSTPETDWDLVSFEVKSWGAPVTSWRILANGGGSWTEAVRSEGQPPTVPPALAWHEIEPDPSNYATLQEILQRLPATAPDSAKCERFMTDAAYGLLRMTKGATTTEIAWNDGCFDEDYRAFLSILKDADAHMAALGKAAPVTRTEEPPRR